MEHPAAATATATGCHKQPLTTFVQTDTNTFREVVQRLTGPSETSNTPPKATTTATKMICNKSKTTSKLHERRQYMKPKLEIVKPYFHFKKSNSTDQLQHYLSPSSKSPSSTGLITSPAGLTTPSGVLAKLSLLEEDKKSAEITKMPEEEEEKAIKERRFYLHPSPRSKAIDYIEPPLLTLFPLTSPTTTEKV